MIASRPTTVLLAFIGLTAIGGAQGPVPATLSEIAFLTSAAGNCTGVRFRNMFVLTAAHCVAAPGNFVNVKLNGGTVKVRKILAKDNALKLAVVCAPDAGGSIGVAASGVNDKQTVSVVDEGAFASGRVFSASGKTFGVDPHGPSLCSGDSGGPALRGQRVHGVLDQAHCSESGSGLYYLTTSPEARTFLGDATGAAKQKECAPGS